MTRSLLCLVTGLISFSAFAAPKAPHSVPVTPTHSSGLHFTDFTAYVGPNFASVSSNNPLLEGKTGWILGMHAGAAIASGIYFAPGIQIADRGFGGSQQGTSYTLDVTYLEFPALMIAKLTSEDTSAVPFFEFGPNLGFRLGTHCSAEAFATCTVTGTEHINSMDFSLDFGAGAEIPVNDKGQAISAELRYHHGLSAIADIGSPLHNRGIEFLVGYHF